MVRDPDKETIAGFAKGLRVIEAFDAGRPQLTITDVAGLTGLERATARRCLLTLVRDGYADYDGKFYRLTPKVLRLGFAYLSSTPLPRLVQPFLEQLATQTGEHFFDGPRIQTNATHGTGCTLASGIAAGLARGLKLTDAVALARAYLTMAIARAPGLGKGNGPIDHGWPSRDPEAFATMFAKWRPG